MNHQQAFNNVVAFARKQNAKSIALNQRSCFYREGYNVINTNIHKGRMCFVGAFIPDSLYDPQMEDKDAEEVFDKFPTLFTDHFKIKDLTKDETIQFWMDMQQIHDEQRVADWYHAFINYARDNRLKYVATR